MKVRRLGISSHVPRIQNASCLFTAFHNNIIFTFLLAWIFTAVESASVIEDCSSIGRPYCSTYLNCYWSSESGVCLQKTNFIYPTKSPTPEPTAILSDGDCSQYSNMWDCADYMDCEWSSRKVACVAKPPTPRPTAFPTVAPTPEPTNSPTGSPTLFPTDLPTLFPTNTPTTLPTHFPTELPTTAPTSKPTGLPTLFPTNTPTSLPTRFPTELPTTAPTPKPTELPTLFPSKSPTKSPTNQPSEAPFTTTKVPTKQPTLYPTKAPTLEPTYFPTFSPTAFPTMIPTTPNPTQSPTWSPFADISQSGAVDLFSIDEASTHRSILGFETTVNASLVLLGFEKALKTVDLYQLYGNTSNIEGLLQSQVLVSLHNISTNDTTNDPLIIAQNYLCADPTVASCTVEGPDSDIRRVLSTQDLQPLWWSRVLRQSDFMNAATANIASRSEFPYIITVSEYASAYFLVQVYENTSQASFNMQVSSQAFSSFMQNFTEEFGRATGVDIFSVFLSSNLCFNVTCQNNGTCQEIDNEASCQCISAFSGELCEIQTATSTTPISIGVWIILAIGVIVVPGLIIAEYRRRKNGQGSFSKRSAKIADADIYRKRSVLPPQPRAGPKCFDGKKEATSQPRNLPRQAENNQKIVQESLKESLHSSLSSFESIKAPSNRSQNDKSPSDSSNNLQTHETSNEQSPISFGNEMREVRDSKEKSLNSSQSGDCFKSVRIQPVMSISPPSLQLPTLIVKAETRDFVDLDPPRHSFGTPVSSSVNDGGGFHPPPKPFLPNLKHTHSAKFSSIKATPSAMNMILGISQNSSKAGDNYDEDESPSQRSIPTAKEAKGFAKGKLDKSKSSDASASKHHAVRVIPVQEIEIVDGVLETEDLSINSKT